MKRVYKVEGIDCANCAASLEEALSKIENIDAVSVNFLTQKCAIEASSEHMKEVCEKALAVIAKKFPDAEVSRG